MEVVPNGRRGKSTVLEIGPVDKRLQDQLTVHPGSRNHQPRRIAFVVERMLDIAAKELGIDRAEIRRRNFIPPEADRKELPTEASPLRRFGGAIINLIFVTGLNGFG